MKRGRPMVIQVICAWCGKDMGTNRGSYTMEMRDGKLVRPISHGICEPCQVKYFPKQPNRIENTTEPAVCE